MDKKTKLEVLNRFFEANGKHGKPEVTCPDCGTALRIEGDIQTSYTVRCGTDNCFVSEFRGL